MKFNINTYGFLGDNLFQTDVARGLKLKYPGCLINVNTRWPHISELLKYNPNVDSINKSYVDAVDINYGPFDISIPPPTEAKIIANLEPTSEYVVYTFSEYDEFIKQQLKDLSRPILGILANWNEKTFGFTPEEYERGINIPPVGYGGRRRDTDWISEQLSKKYSCILVGKENGISQHQTEPMEFVYTASLLKHIDWFVGTEGGLANLAAGVGTRTISTGDYVHQLYGWNGVIRKLKNPQLGPHLYFPDNNHIMLDPYLSDEETLNKIINIIEYDT